MFYLLDLEISLWAAMLAKGLPLNTHRLASPHWLWGLLGLAEQRGAGWTGKGWEGKGRGQAQGKSRSRQISPQ